MKRRGFLSLLFAPIVAPFIPKCAIKPKTAPIDWDAINALTLKHIRPIMLSDNFFQVSPFLARLKEPFVVMESTAHGKDHFLSEFVKYKNEASFGSVAPRDALYWTSEGFLDGSKS